ncbi:MAG: guanylate kinase [Desulfovibrionaceae bacterium]|nr:guanylate kinase [Desulfovibrionaceae bacterium]
MTNEPIRRRGLPLVVCAPSGTGKTTLIRKLRQEFPLNFSVSCTTRPPRQGETAGQDYIFLDRAEFLKKKRTGYFAEWAEVHGNFYGTPLQPVQERLNRGEDMLFDIDVQGAAQLALSLPEARFVFILPPSLEVLAQRLHSRGTDSEEAIKVRLVNAKVEIGTCHWFDAWIVNNDLEQAYAELRAFYLAAALRPSLRPGLPRAVLEGEYHGRACCRS